MTAYEMRISDWSSDVCSSDLCCRGRCSTRLLRGVGERRIGVDGVVDAGSVAHVPRRRFPAPDRKSVVSGKSVSVRVDLGGRRVIKKKLQRYTLGFLMYPCHELVTLIQMKLNDTHKTVV